MDKSGKKKNKREVPECRKDHSETVYHILLAALAVFVTALWCICYHGRKEAMDPAVQVQQDGSTEGTSFPE